MRLVNAFSLISDLKTAVSAAIWPTLKFVLCNPALLVKPKEVSRVFMGHVWEALSNDVDELGSGVKETLITPNAYGVVLDVGAGHGHTVRYLDRARVTKYVPLEPNHMMHSSLRKQANAAGYHEHDGTLIILGSGIEDVQPILLSLSSFQPVDTIISTLTLCSIPDPERNLARLMCDVLKSGGQFLMYDHVLSKREDGWQRFWAPVWACAFGGCRMDRRSDVTVAGICTPGQRKSIWKSIDTWEKVGEDQESLFWHAIGKYVKD